MTHLEEIESILALLSEYPVSEIEVERAGFKVRASRPASFLRAAEDDSSLASMADEPETPQELTTRLEEEARAEPKLVCSAMVGLFRHREPPLGYGAWVDEGDSVGSVEAIKVLNDVRSEFSGRVADVLCEEGSPVEYGQPLFRLIPASLEE